MSIRRSKVIWMDIACLRRFIVSIFGCRALHAERSEAICVVIHVRGQLTDATITGKSRTAPPRSRQKRATGKGDSPRDLTRGPAPRCIPTLHLQPVNLGGELVEALPRRCEGE